MDDDGCGYCICENCCTRHWLDVCGSVNYDVIAQMVSEGGEICKSYFASFLVSNQYINGYGMQEHDCFYRHAQQHLNGISTLALSLLFDVVCEVKSWMLAAVHA